MLGEDLSADLGVHRGRGSDSRAVGAHYLASEGLLLVGAFDHIYVAVESEVGASHRESRTPLTSTCLGGNAAKALLLCIVSLSDSRI